MKNKAFQPIKLQKSLTGIKGFDEITDGCLPKNRTINGFEIRGSMKLILTSLIELLMGLLLIPICSFFQSVFAEI